MKGKNLPKCQGKFAEDLVSIKKLDNKNYWMSWLSPYRFGDDIMCVKEYEGENWYDSEIMEVTSGDYFNSLDIPSVVGYPTLMTVASSYYDSSVPGHGIATHYLHAIPGIEFMDASSIKRFIKTEIREDARIWGVFPPNISESHDNWWLLEDNYLKKKLLEIMTPQCFNDFISLFIADKMGGYTDRHGENYFFYRRAGSHLWDGIVAIDNERVAHHADFLRNRSMLGGDYNKMLNEQKISTCTPQWSNNYSTHGENMREIREYLEKGKFNEREVDVIKGALKYPYADNMKKTCDNYEIHLPDALYDGVARLWEFNRDCFKDL